MAQTELTQAEEQVLRDMEPDGYGLSRYDAYSTPVNLSDLLAKVQAQFEAVPSYCERHKGGFIEAEG